MTTHESTSAPSGGYAAPSTCSTCGHGLVPDHGPQGCCLSAHCSGLRCPTKPSEREVVVRYWTQTCLAQSTSHRHDCALDNHPPTLRHRCSCGAYWPESSESPSETGWRCLRCSEWVLTPDRLAERKAETCIPGDDELHVWQHVRLPLRSGDRLVDRALGLRMYGEGAPGNPDTWATWERDAETHLREVWA